MKEEGFVNKALHIIKDEDRNARWLANQSLFNGSDNQKVQLSAKVSISFSLNVYNDGYNDLDSLMENVKNTLKDGGKLALVGFGSFVVKQRAARQGRNPQTGETIEIAARNVVSFKPGSELKEAVN